MYGKGWGSRSLRRFSGQQDLPVGKGRRTVTPQPAALGGAPLVDVVIQIIIKDQPVKVQPFADGFPVALALVVVLSVGDLVPVVRAGSRFRTSTATPVLPGLLYELPVQLLAGQGHSLSRQREL